MSETTPSQPRSALRELIRDAMRTKGIRNVDGEKGLAKLAGVARNTIYAWEGGAYPRIGELEKVGRFLGLPAWQLLRAWEQGETAGGGVDMTLSENGQPTTVVEVKSLESKVDRIITREEVLELVDGVERRLVSAIQGEREAVIEAAAERFVKLAAQQLRDELGGGPPDGTEDPPGAAGERLQGPAV